MLSHKNLPALKKTPHLSLNTEGFWSDHRLQLFTLFKEAFFIQEKLSNKGDLCCMIRGIGTLDYSDVALFMPLELRFAGLVKNLTKALNS